MKQTIYILLLMLFGMGCNKPYPGFVLNGKIKGVEAGTIYLSYVDSLGKPVQDSAKIQDGKFVFRGGITEPTTAYLAKDLNVQSMDDPGFADFWIEPQVMSLELKDGDFKQFVLAGSVTNDEEQFLNKQKKPVRKEMEPLLVAYRAEKDHEKAAAIREQFDPYNERMNKMDMAFIVSHPDSYVSVSMMTYKVSSLTAETAQAYYDSFSSRIKESTLGQQVAEEIRKLKCGSPGSPAALFSKPDINGEAFSLADLKGKYVLIDFWASWCVPCRKSNPHLKELYAKYKDQGFVVVCVADDDRSEDKWKAAVEKDRIGEFKHVLRGLKWNGNKPDRSEDISEEYGIHTLPTKILVDKEGMIIGRYGGGGGTQEDMDQKLKEIFGV